MTIPDIGVRHMAVVLRYWVDDWATWKQVTKGEASINRLRWVDTKADAINLADFEYWSQLVMREFYRTAMKMVPGYKFRESRHSPNSRPMRRRLDRFGQVCH